MMPIGKVGLTYKNKTLPKNAYPSSAPARIRFKPKSIRALSAAIIASLKKALNLLQGLVVI